MTIPPFIRRGADKLQFRGDGFAHAIHFLQAIRGGTDDFGETAEFGNQGFGQGVRIAALDDPEQDHFEEFIVGQGFGACFAETLPQAFAMAKEVGFRGGLVKTHRHFLNLVGRAMEAAG